LVSYELREGTLRIDCRNWVIEPSIEDSDACMGVIIDLLREVKNVEKIVLVEKREVEYDLEQVRLLTQIADLLNKLELERFLEKVELGPSECNKYYPERIKELFFLVRELMRKDPVGAWVKLNRMIGRTKFLIQKLPPACKKYFISFLANKLEYLKRNLEACDLIKKALPLLKTYKLGDRRIYREFFKPVIKPVFMFTRFKLIPPKEGYCVERYKLPGDIQVEIYRIPGRVRFYYHITPPEFTLSEEKHALLEEAIRYLSERRPSEEEFRDMERARETYFSLGKTIVKELARRFRLRLKEKEINELASILTRYTTGFGILEVLLADERIQDIYINSPIGSTPIFVQHSEYEECETNLIPTREDAEAWATRFRMYSGRPLDEANPVLDTELIIPGGRARVCAITRTLSPEGLAFAIRRHRERPWTFPLFMRVKMFDPLFAGLMSFIIDGGRCVLIAGGRGSGKTSFLSSMILEIMKKFRVVVLEDTLEIPVTQIRSLGYNIERLKSRSVITRVETELPAEEALRTALRLGDSVLIIGEVRSKEALALYEAMRIGALANLVAGTIHGESAYGVFDRVVHDLGVPPTSFKATDLIIICSNLKSADGLHRFRRITELVEVKKQWKKDPLEEGGFVTLMQYSAKEDRLKPTDVLLEGESFVLNEIARKVREWHANWDAVWDNILLRAKIKQAMLEFAEKLKRPEILEAKIVSEANEMFHLFSEQVRQEVGSLDSKLIYERWLEWFRKYLKS